MCYLTVLNDPLESSRHTGSRNGDAASFMRPILPILAASPFRGSPHATGAAQAASGTLPPPRAAAPVVPSPFPPPQVQQQSILPQPQSGQGQTGQPTDAQSTPVRPLPPR